MDKHIILTALESLYGCKTVLCPDIQELRLFFEKPFGYIIINLTFKNLDELPFERLIDIINQELDLQIKYQAPRLLEEIKEADNEI